MILHNQTYAHAHTIKKERQWQFVYSKVRACVCVDVRRELSKRGRSVKRAMLIFTYFSSDCTILFKMDAVRDLHYTKYSADQVVWSGACILTLKSSAILECAVVCCALHDKFVLTKFFTRICVNFCGGRLPQRRRRESNQEWCWRMMVWDIL